MLGTLHTPALFEDRRAAGRRLGERIAAYGDDDPVVIGLPRGGVPVAYEVARRLDAPLDVLIVRKIGAPLQPEYGIGAVGEDGVALVDAQALDVLGVCEDDLREIIAREREELERRRRRYRGDRPAIPVEGRTVILVDDGLATGATAIAGARVLRKRGAARVVLAVPVAPRGAHGPVSGEVDELIALETPEDFFAVGQFYRRFGATPDEEVRALLDAASRAPGAAEASAHPSEPAPGDPPPSAASRAGGLDWMGIAARSVSIPVGRLALPGDLRLPPSSRGLVVFAHGSGSSRKSRRNVAVAAALGAGGLATLLFDLLTPEEGQDPGKVFDIELLVERLLAATAWTGGQGELQGLPLGCFGASTGAAAALGAAAQEPRVRCVVSRGGRPDLAARWLSAVRAPTLLIVGGEDRVVLELNRRAQRALACPSELAVVPGATHLFEEPGALEQVTRLAAGWFDRHLLAPARRAGSAEPPREAPL